MLQSDHEPPTPTNPTTYPLRSRVHAVIPRGLSPHRLYCRRHGGAWPSLDHASFRGIGRHCSLAAPPPQPTSPWSARDHATRLHVPLLLKAPRVPAAILLPRGLSCCCKLSAHDHAPVVGLLVFSIAHGYSPVEALRSPLPTAVLPPQDFGLHCPRSCSRRRS